MSSNNGQSIKKFPSSLGLISASGWQVKDDANGNLGVFNPSGTEIFHFDVNGFIIWDLSSNTLPIAGSHHIGVSGATLAAGNLRLNSLTGQAVAVESGNNAALQVATKVLAFGGNTTEGQGLPPIWKASSQNPVNAAPTAVSFTPPVAAGSYRVHFYLDITVATTITFIAKLTYTDPAGTARSANLTFIAEGGTTLLAGGPAANTAGQFYGSQTFAVDNSATAITVVDNAGTYTTCNYRWVVVLEQLA